MELPKWWNKDKKRKSLNQEKKLAKEVKGSTTLNSGATKFEKGDVRNNIFLFECKRTDRKSLILKKEVWNKIKKEAIRELKVPCMELEIQDINLIVLDKKDFLELTNEKN